MSETKLYRNPDFDNLWIGRSKVTRDDARLYIDDAGLGINYCMKRDEWVALRGIIDQLLADWPEQAGEVRA